VGLNTYIFLKINCVLGIVFRVRHLVDGLLLAVGGVAAIQGPLGRNAVHKVVQGLPDFIAEKIS
jgi:hypothetical protein